MRLISACESARGRWSENCMQKKSQMQMPDASSSCECQRETIVNKSLSLDVAIHEPLHNKHLRIVNKEAVDMAQKPLRQQQLHDRLPLQGS